MNGQEAPISRRLGLVYGTRWLIGSAIVIAIGQTETARATKADKRDFFYQEKPKDGKSCATCRLYSESQVGKGNCAIVEGDVSPNGWCTAYSPRA